MVHADRVVLLPREKSVCAQNESCKFCRGPRLTGCTAPRQSTAEPRGGQDTPLMALGKLVKSEGSHSVQNHIFPNTKPCEEASVRGFSLTSSSQDSRGRPPSPLFLAQRRSLPCSPEQTKSGSQS